MSNSNYEPFTSSQRPLPLYERDGKLYLTTSMPPMTEDEAAKWGWSRTNPPTSPWEVETERELRYLYGRVASLQKWLLLSFAGMTVLGCCLIALALRLGARSLPS